MFIRTIASTLTATAASACVILSASVASVGNAAESRPVAVTNVRIIDGNGGPVIEKGTIVISGKKIVEVGEAASVKIPSGARRIDGRGKTATPGLADLHAHVPDAFGYQRFLNASLYAGVTTMMDTGNSPSFIYALRSKIADGHVLGPRLYAVGPFIDSADAFFLGKSIAVASKDQVPRYVKQMADDKADMMKLYLTLSDRLVTVLSAEGKKYGLRSIIDQWNRNGSEDLARTGISGFAHMPIHELTDEDVAAIKENNVFFLTTLTVIEAIDGRRWRMTPSYLDNPLIASTVTRQERELYRTNFSHLTDQQLKAIAFDPVDMGGTLRNVKKLSDAGVVMAVGCDAGAEAGDFAGECVHRELELLVEGGLTPLQAISAATKNAAVVMKAQQEWGTLAPGRDADILLVDGKPDQNISDMRKLSEVMMDGAVLDREKLVIDQSTEPLYYAPPQPIMHKWW